MKLINFACHAVDSAGVVRRIEFVATTEADARRMCFARCPQAVRVSCRPTGYTVKEQRNG